MIKRAMAVALVLALALTLGGCRLAMEEASDRGGDLFVGVSLRVEDWGEPAGWDEEGHPYWASEDEEEPLDLTPAQASALIRGELPADLLSAERPLGPYAYYTVTREENGETYHESVNTWPGSAQAHIAVTDEGETCAVDLKVYVCGEAVARHDIDHSYVSMYLDSVYQRPDGSVYCVRDRAGIAGYINGFAQTVRQEQTVTDIHGEVSGYAMEISSEFILVPELQEATVLAFDAAHNLLGTMPVVPEADAYGYWDCEILPPAGTAYLILEETAIAAEGGTVFTRSFADMPSSEYDRSNALFTLYVPSEDHLARPCCVRLPDQP